jgi:DNA-binding helix-hairpin-helix protein with protein kinase domain
MGSLLERLTERECATRERVERLRGQIDALVAQLAEAENELTRLEITRETVLALAAEEEAEHAADPVLSQPAYRHILAAFEHAADGLRARDLCQALDAGLEPKQIEGMRAKLKRLVGRGILSEPEPGLFALPRPRTRT